MGYEEVLPFGWKYSPVICQRLLGSLVRDLIPPDVLLIHYLEPPTGGGQRHPGRALLGASSTLVPPVQEPRLGHRLLLPHRPRGAWWLCGGPAVPDGAASGHARPPSSRPASPARVGGSDVLLSRPGAPRLPGPPRLRAPYSLPVHSAPQDVRGPPPLALGPGSPDPRSALA